MQSRWKNGFDSYLNPLKEQSWVGLYRLFLLTHNGRHYNAASSNQEPSPMPKCETTCQSGGGTWTRIANDLVNSKAGVEDCAARCLARGDKYFGLECPAFDSVKKINKVCCHKSFIK